MCGALLEGSGRLTPGAESGPSPILSRTGKTPSEHIPWFLCVLRTLKHKDGVPRGAGRSRPWGFAEQEGFVSPRAGDASGVSGTDQSRPSTAHWWGKVSCWQGPSTCLQVICVRSPFLRPLVCLSPFALQEMSKARARVQATWAPALSIPRLCGLRQMA